MPTRVLIIGLDGATLDLIEPWAASGALPNLASLMDAGSWGSMRSTVPPATFPAWTSLMTGVNPGQHGVFDFTQLMPGTYRLQFINATYRRQPSMWRLLSQAGKRVAVLGCPATYPPEAVNGVLVSGFDSPVATGIDRSFMYPPELYDELQQEVGRYQITGFQELRIRSGWHRMALRKLLQAASRRTEIATYLLDREAWDCFFVHYGESDTVAHHFWAFHDAASPRYNRDMAERFGHGILAVYEALDRAVGELRAHAGQTATVLIVSDHGSGGTGDRVIYLNRWLDQQGWLRFRPAGASGRVAGGVKRLGLTLPRRFQEWVFRGPLRGLVNRLESGSRLAGIDWANTRAFSEEVNTFPAIWLNVRGREPEGIVEPGEEYESLRTEIISRLAGWRDPGTGQTVIKAAWRREELYHGPAAGRAPDIVLELALDQGYAYTVLSSQGRSGKSIHSLAPGEHIGAKGGSMNGSHRSEGVLMMAGPGVTPGTRLSGVQILDVAPSMLHLLELPISEQMEGHVLLEALATNQGATGASVGGEDLPPPNPYSSSQARTVRAKLRGLGYQA